LKDFLAQIVRIQASSRLYPDCVQVRDISTDNFHEIEKRAGQEGRAVGLFFYLADARLLIVTLPTDPHEELHRFIYTEIKGQARDMGLAFEIGSVGTRKAPAALGGESSGESDSNFFPHLQRSASSGDWPSVVIEAGHSYTYDSLKAKASWWLRESNYTVRLVLLVKMEIRRREIWIEKWKGLPLLGYGGPVTRSRSSLPLEPRQISSRVTVSRAAGITDAHPNRFNPASYNIARGNLQIDFEYLFCRPAQAPGEADININMTGLRQFAVNCWRKVHD
jgi:hypothetical protein